MDIQVTKEVYELAKTGQLQVITAHLDPGADKALQEGARPKQVTLRARGTRKKGLTFALIGTPSTVLRGYAVSTQRGKVIDTMRRPTARVVIGAAVLPTDHSKLPTEDEIPPG